MEMQRTPGIQRTPVVQRTPGIQRTPVVQRTRAGTPAVQRRPRRYHQPARGDDARKVLEHLRRHHPSHPGPAPARRGAVRTSASVSSTLTDGLFSSDIIGFSPFARTNCSLPHKRPRARLQTRVCANAPVCECASVWDWERGSIPLRTSAPFQCIGFCGCLFVCLCICVFECLFVCLFDCSFACSLASEHGVERAPELCGGLLLRLGVGLHQRDPLLHLPSAIRPRSR